MLENLLGSESSQGILVEHFVTCCQQLGEKAPRLAYPGAKTGYRNSASLSRHQEPNDA